MSGNNGFGAHHIQSLARGLAVIRAFEADRPELTLSDVSRTTGLTRAATRRFLLTLVDLGYARVDGRLFALTPRVLELGYAYLSSLSVAEVSKPHLEKLSAAVGESASVSVLDGHDVVYVARVATSRIMAVAITVGTRFPAFATSMGRVLLAGLPSDDLHQELSATEFKGFTSRTVNSIPALTAELDRVRAQGWAIVDGELDEGLRSAAVPIRDEGRVIAAMNVSTHRNRTSLEDIRRRLLPALLSTAASIEADLDIPLPRRTSARSS